VATFAAEISLCSSLVMHFPSMQDSKLFLLSRFFKYDCAYCCFHWAYQNSSLYEGPHNVFSATATNSSSRNSWKKWTIMHYLFFNFPAVINFIKFLNTSCDLCTSNGRVLTPSNSCEHWKSLKNLWNWTNIVCVTFCVIFYIVCGMDQFDELSLF
jgi:hypothetical protein